jgi:hypothetical protein
VLYSGNKKLIEYGLMLACRERLFQSARANAALAESEPVHFAIRRDDGYVALGFVEGIVAIFERGFSWRGGFVLGAVYCVYAKYCFRETSRPRRGLVDRNRKFLIPQVKSIRPLNQPAAANFHLRYRKLAIKALG